VPFARRMPASVRRTRSSGAGDTRPASGTGLRRQ
jgi:hypothetical protein